MNILNSSSKRPHENTGGENSTEGSKKRTIETDRQQMHFLKIPQEIWETNIFLHFAHEDDFLRQFAAVNHESRAMVGHFVQSILKKN